MTNVVPAGSGTWTFASVETGGKEEPIELFKGMTVTFEGDKYTVKKDGEVVQVGRQKLDPSTSPRTLDATLIEGVNKGAVMLGIYEFSGATLKVYPGADHGLAQTHQDRFNADLLAFIKG